jgi:penicillin amidase
MVRRLTAVGGSLVLFVTVSSAVPTQSPTPDKFAVLARESLATIDGTLSLAGLRARVEVIRDRWGVPHIYAENIDDLFTAQGFVAAQDRLWQMELWRRQREGRLAEILGVSAVARDRTARLLKYRGPMDDREWTSYHPEGKRIFTAFAAGVNAFIAASKDKLPIEFRITGITPEPWTAETVVLRAATFGNASSELALARNVVRLGLEAANKAAAPDPWDELAIPEGLDLKAIDQSVTTGRGGGGGIRPELIEPYRTWARGGGVLLAPVPAVPADAIAEPGSNNWVVNGALSATGKPVVANDPHREVGNPSLRYISHLVAPGWNVIGASEAPFAGVAIGHNDRLGWGLTIVGTDQEDVFVEELNPANGSEVRWRDAWEPIRTVTEQIAVKGQAAETVELKFTRHGPIFHEDRARNKAYALRSALLEPGTAPYLAGLRLAQSRNCREFLDAAMYWKSPSENLICGDVDGNISWQASALTPKRNGWFGRLPVPGSGRYEWDGFRTDLPRELNPPRGFIATANNNIQPKGYTPPLMFKSSSNVEYERVARLLELIQPGKKYTVDDHRRMQLDTLHLRARAELALFRGWTASAAEVERARQELASWDATLARDSRAAAIYSAWRAASSPQERDVTRGADLRRGEHEASLVRAIGELRKSQGEDWAQWRWGRMHTRAFPHANFAMFGLPTVERPGGTGTVAADGASYREILDVADWDRSIVTNVPGQSAQPGSPFYGNLLKLWAEDEYFPLVYSRTRVDAVQAYRLTLSPMGSGLSFMHRQP